MKASSDDEDVLPVITIGAFGAEVSDVDKVIVLTSRVVPVGRDPRNEVNWLSKVAWELASVTIGLTRVRSSLEAPDVD